ncbi:DegT/DnrJ/EryC1/StrS family aminotransferase, partial [Alphaproteobacteria bacterium]|nr:DegT/DnrJ/EryC1/StrS family aminotransferase [Alphaproteobacteria bacterium]
YKNVYSVIKSNWISEGEKVREFEKKLAKICNRKYSLAFNNATAAMISALMALGIKEEDEVIVPSFTHCADPNAISVVGAKPVFADVNLKTMCLDLDNIVKVLTKKTKAILFVSVYGSVDEIDKIYNFCKKNKIFLLNDCAPALFGKFKNKPIASYGDCSFLSFFADKTITTGEGGMLLSNNKKLIYESNIIKHDGRKERGHDIILKKGYNFRFNEILAAIGLAQLQKYRSLIKKKIEINKKYNAKLKGIPGITIFELKKDIIPHRNIIFYKKSKKLIKFLTSNGIGVRNLFMPMHSMPAYNYKGQFKNSMSLYKTGICLPSAPSLTEKNITKISNLIKIFVQNENITK